MAECWYSPFGCDRGYFRSFFFRIRMERCVIFCTNFRCLRKWILRWAANMFSIEGKLYTTHNWIDRFDVQHHLYAKWNLYTEFRSTPPTNEFPTVHLVYVSLVDRPTTWCLKPIKNKQKQEGALSVHGKKLCIQIRIRVLNTIRARTERNSFATWNPFHLKAMALFKIIEKNSVKKSRRWRFSDQILRWLYIHYTELDLMFFSVLSPLIFAHNSN